MTRNRTWMGLPAVALMTAAMLGLAACAAPAAEDAASGTQDQAAAEIDVAATSAATVMDAEGVAGTEAPSDTGAATAVVSDTLRPGMGMGMGAHAGGAMHRRMEGVMHQAMLDEAQAQGLITAEDAALFLKVHAAIDPYRPAESMGQAMGLSDDARKAMQRTFVTQAIDAGTVTEAEAARFTEIHDLLIDEGIMGRFEGNGNNDDNESPAATDSPAEPGC